MDILSGRLLLMASGWICIGLGIAGMFLPLVPTVPLLLLAAACFARSSPKAYSWLLDHPRLGPMVTGYIEGSGIPLRAKVIALATLWLSISLSIYLVSSSNWLIMLLLLVVASAITLYLLRLPTRQLDSDVSE